MDDYRQKGLVVQKWKKLGLIFDPTDRFDWMQTHAQLPVVIPLTTGSCDGMPNCLFRIYFATRDNQQRSQVGFVDIDINNPKEILNISKKPVLEFGAMGYFDEHGVYPSSIIEVDGKLYMYYIGWNKGAEYPMFYASIGLAISEDGGNTFKKYSKAPIMSRSEYDPWMVTAPFVFKDDDIYRMYYVSGLDWKTNTQGKLTSKYHVKYAYSKDGINWVREGKIAVDFKSESETNIAKSFVIKEDNMYKAWFPYVNIEPYKIGYGESKDGILFERKDDEIILMKDNEIKFDNEMQCYPYLFDTEKGRFMAYNGNNYGYNGFGLAVLEE